MAKEFEIVEIGVGEGVDLRFGIKDCQTGLIGGELFYRSMFCKWTTTLANSTRIICQ